MSSKPLFAAALAAAASLAGPALATPAPGFDHGRQIAVSRCAACHEVEAAGASRDPNAPTFGEVGRRYNPIALEKRLSRIRQRGHGRMPPGGLSETDAEDLVAYIGAVSANH